MTTATQLECSRCGDPLEKYADEVTQVGRCCNNLPPRWGEHREEDEAPRHYECERCGSHRFTYTYVERYVAVVHSTDTDPYEGGDYPLLDIEGGSGDYDERDEDLIRCRDCGHEVPHVDINWA